MGVGGRGGDRNTRDMKEVKSGGGVVISRKEGSNGLCRGELGALLGFSS